MTERIEGVLGTYEHGWLTPLLAPFTVKRSHVQISPCDERCDAGSVTIQPDAHGGLPQIGGEIVTLRQATRVRPHCRTRQCRHEMRSVIGNRSDASDKRR